MKVESEREVAQSSPTLSDPMDCSLPGSSIHGIFQARVLEWGAIAFSANMGLFLTLENLVKIFCDTVIVSIFWMRTVRLTEIQLFSYSVTQLVSVDLGPELKEDCS